MSGKYNTALVDVFGRTNKSMSRTEENLDSFIPLAYAECDNSLPFSGASSIPLCYIIFPATLLRPVFFHPTSLHSFCHLFLGLLLNLVASKFIYNTLLEILFSSILCTCPNHRNLCNLIVLLQIEGI
jgi:hypothetical protein